MSAALGWSQREGDHPLQPGFAAANTPVIGEALPGLDEFGLEEVSWHDHDALAAEQAAFIAAVLDGAPVVVDAAAGRRALAAALAVSEAMAASRARMEASGLIQKLEHGGSSGL